MNCCRNLFGFLPYTRQEAQLVDQTETPIYSRGTSEAPLDTPLDKDRFFTLFKLHMENTLVKSEHPETEHKQLLKALNHAVHLKDTALKGEVLEPLIRSIIRHNDTQGQLRKICTEVLNFSEKTGIIGFNPEMLDFVHSLINPDQFSNSTAPFSGSTAGSSNETDAVFIKNGIADICENFGKFPDPSKLTLEHQKELNYSNYIGLLQEHNKLFQSTMLHDNYHSMNFGSALHIMYDQRVEAYNRSLKVGEFLQQPPEECKIWPPQLLTDWQSGMPLKALSIEIQNQDSLARFDDRLKALEKVKTIMPKIKRPSIMHPTSGIRYQPVCYEILNSARVKRDTAELMSEQVTPYRPLGSDSKGIFNTSMTSSDISLIHQKLDLLSQKTDVIHNQLTQVESSELGKILGQLKTLTTELALKAQGDETKQSIINELQKALDEANAATTAAQLNTTEIANKLKSLCEWGEKIDFSIYDENQKNSNEIWRYINDVESSKARFEIPSIEGHGYNWDIPIAEHYPTCARYINLTLSGLNGTVTNLTENPHIHFNYRAMSEPSKQVACLTGYLHEQSQLISKEAHMDWLASTVTAFISIPSVLKALELRKGSNMDKLQAACLLTTAVLGTLSACPPIIGSSVSAAAGLAAGASLGSAGNSIVNMVRSALSDYSHSSIGTIPGKKDDPMSLFCQQEAHKDNLKNIAWQFATRFVPSMAFFCQHLLEAHENDMNTGLSSTAKLCLSAFSLLSLIDIAGSFKHHNHAIDSMTGIHPSLIAVSAYLDKKENLKQLAQIIQKNGMNMEKDDQCEFINTLISHHPDKSVLERCVGDIFGGRGYKVDSEENISTESEKFLIRLNKFVRKDLQTACKGMTGSYVNKEIIVPLVKACGIKGGVQNGSISDPLVNFKPDSGESANKETTASNRETAARAYV